MMHSFSTRAILLVSFIQFSHSQDAINPTTLRFFPRTSCNPGTSLSYTTVADLYNDNTCHTTPVGTEALYIDTLAEGCAVMAFSDSACSSSAILSQLPITTETCQFYGDGNSIGAWMGVCGAFAGASAASVSTSSATVLLSDTTTSSIPVSEFSTLAVPANLSVSATWIQSGTGMGNGTVSMMSTPTPTPRLQDPDATTSGAAGLRWDGEADGEWARRIVFKALLAMGSAEVMWAFVPV